MEISTGFNFAIAMVKEKIKKVKIARYIIAVNGNRNTLIFSMRQHAHSGLALMLTVKYLQLTLHRVYCRV